MATPSGVFDEAEVDVRVVRGNFIPCRSCHWYRDCVIPRGSMLGKSKEYYGSNDIMYHDGPHELGRTNNIVYHCLEYTTVKKK